MSLNPGKKLKKENFFFDKILIDAPCSGEGTLRSTPKTYLMWNIKTIKKLSRIQKKLVSSAIGILKPGGEIVYSTCTVTPEENEEVIDDFLANYPEFVLDSISDVLPASCGSLVDNRGFFKAYPHLHNMDGFFAARLIKRGIKSFRYTGLQF